MIRSGVTTIGHPVDVASGVVYLRRLDMSIKGRLPVKWLRYYSTAALDRMGPHGWGWSTLYSAQLILNGDSFAFFHMEGVAGTFTNAFPRLVRGEIVRDLGASAELSLNGEVYVVSVWDTDKLTAERYQFADIFNNGQLVLVGFEDATGVGIDLKYDASQRLTTIQQRIEMRTLGIVYNARRLIASISALDGQAWRQICAYTYDAQDRLVRVENAIGSTEEYQYDSTGRLLAERTRSGAVFVFIYDIHGRCTRTAGADGFDAKTLVFKDNIGWTEVTDSHGHLSRFQWNEKGQITYAINAAGEVSRTEYDEHNRIKARVYPGDRTLRYEYDDAGNRKTIIDPLGRVLQFVFNERHQVTELTDPRGNIWISEYDAAGRWISHKTPLGFEWQFEYDRRGNLVSTIDPRKFRSHIIYRSPDTWEFSDYAGNITSIQENYLGRVVQRIEPSLRVTTYTRDALGRLVSISTSTGTNIRYEYDSVGNVVFIRDSLGAFTSFRFGTCRRLLERTDPVGGKRQFRWGTEPGELLEIVNENGESYSIEYDPIGRIRRESNFSGRSFYYEYDSNGFRSAYASEAGERIEYSWDAAGQLVSFQVENGERIEYEYDALGDLTRATNSDSETRFKRDAYGRVIHEVQDGLVIDFSFDPVGCLIGITTSTGADITFGYDANAMPISAQINGQQLWRSRRDPDRLEVERHLINGLHLRQDFDRNGSLQSQLLTSPNGSTLLARSFTYDAAGRLGVCQDSTWGELNYVYDSAHRIIASTSSHGNELFTYDLAGNITSTSTDSTPAPFEYAPGNRLVRAGASSLKDDTDGRVISQYPAHGSFTRDLKLTWSGTDRLMSITSGNTEWEYRYDAFGRRIEKKGPQGSVRFVWAGDLLLQEIFSSGQFRTWITPPGTYSPLAMSDGQQNLAIISDAIGTARDVVDSKGKLRWSALYAIWGAVKLSRGDLQDFPLRFPGQYFDSETGLHYSRFRYYDPRYGRFLSPDPLGLNGGLNEYLYAPNPLGWIDPLGLIIVYRNLHPDEDPSKGLNAKIPGRDMTPTGHVMNGSRENFKGSQFISTTTDPEVAASWRKDGQAQVRFDTDHVVPDSKGNLNILDISSREKAINEGIKGRAVNYATNSKEVLVEGHVPPEALEPVPPEEEEEKGC